MTAPQIPLAIQNGAASLSSPARCRRRRIVTFSLLLARPRDPSACRRPACAGWRPSRRPRAWQLACERCSPSPLDARFRSLLAGQIGIDEQRRQRRAKRRRRSARARYWRCRYPSIASPKRVAVGVVHLRAARAPAPGGGARRNIRRAPRSAGEQCRSSGGGR